MSDPGFEVLASDIQTFVLQMLANASHLCFLLLGRPTGRTQSFHK